MDKGDKLEIKIEKSLEELENNLNKIKELDQLLEKLETNGKEG